MAIESSNSDGFEVEDDEGFVDRQRKKQILENRREVEETAKEVFAQVKLGRYTEEQAVGVWHEIVRNFLLSIEPLLKDESLPNSTYAYLEAPLGKVRFSPPEKYQQAQNPAEIRDQGAQVLSEPPEPTEYTISGLKEVIEQEVYTESWEVRINEVRGIQAKENGPHWETVSVEKPMPKVALRNAVRVADEFLQNANVGLAVGGSSEGKGDYSQIEDVDYL